MCQVLLRVKNKVNPDSPELDVKCLKRGDIVTIVEDSHVWSPAELTNPDWRIIDLPNVTVNQALVLTTPETDNIDLSPARQRMLQARKYFLDHENISLPAAFINWVRDDTRSQPIRTINLTPAQLLGLQRERPARTT